MPDVSEPEGNRRILSSKIASWAEHRTKSLQSIIVKKKSHAQYPLAEAVTISARDVIALSRLWPLPRKRNEEVMEDQIMAWIKPRGQLRATQRRPTGPR